jgi:putative protease
MGGTPYEVTAWQIELDEGTILSHSQLNWLRRRLIEKLDEARLQPWTRKPARDVKAVAELMPVRTHRQASRTRKIELAVTVSSLEQAKEAVKAGADWVYFRLEEFCPAKDKNRLNSIVESSKFCRARQRRFALSTPSILSDSGLNEVLDIISTVEGQFDTVVVANFGLAYALRDSQRLILDYQLNLYDPIAYQALVAFEPMRVTLSPELNQEQIKSMVDIIPVVTEILVHGSLEVLIAEHCIPLASAEKCRRMCETGRWAIRDAKGYVFPVELDSHCRSHLFNSKELCLLNDLPVLSDLNVEAIRLMLERYSAEEVKAITGIYRQALDHLASGQTDLRKIAEQAAKESPSFSDYTRGHFHRGIQ